METSDITAKRILVVEDEPAISEVCRRVLMTEGFAVDIAVNGKVAQDMIAAQQYDLYLIDMRTPAMSGKELYIWLEEQYPRLARRVLFTTGDIMAGDTQSFLQKIARPCIPKPFAPDELRAMVRKTLEEIEKWK